jgi:hypothetical protein
MQPVKLLPATGRTPAFFLQRRNNQLTRVFPRFDRNDDNPGVFLGFEQHAVFWNVQELNTAPKVGLTGSIGQFGMKQKRPQ